MPAYFDTSVVLSILVGDQFTRRACLWWEEHQDRVSSILLEAESVITLRRHHRQHQKTHGNRWLADRLSELRSMLEEIKLQNVDEEVVKILASEERLSGCRSLDALHLATILFLQAGSDEPLVVCTFDAEMAKLAGKIGLEVRP